MKSCAFEFSISETNRPKVLLHTIQPEDKERFLSYREQKTEPSESFRSILSLEISVVHVGMVPQDASG